ncbi:scale keratin-like [Dermochelys coriacea]|uniref:scale keratin-like n=1 Tax=Dermochelys coriacea TaxID=27794 RepID=UPI0018E8B97E|nr:scale keratin-like [Dermochelys coriacea]
MSYCPPEDCYYDICPRPCIDVRNEPCVTSCGDSSAVVYAPPVVVRFPGPTLATCPQDSIVGTTLPNLPARAGVPYSSGGGFRGSIGSGVTYGGGYGGGYNGGGYWGGNGVVYGGGYNGGYGSGAWGGYGGGYGGSYGSGGSCGYSRKSYRSISGGRYSGSGYGNCGPC